MSHQSLVGPLEWATEEESNFEMSPSHDQPLTTHDSRATIVALATAPGVAAIAVVRVSGVEAFRVAATLTRGFDPSRAREARVLTLHDRDGAIDRAVVTAFPAPRSFTGEDVVEISCHGGSLTSARVIAACLAAGAREAHPGEFTRRAVLHGKLDLLQAEATGDLLQATAPRQAMQALAQLDGNLSRRITALREELLQVEALLSYAIDFPEEDDGPVPTGRISAAITFLQHQLEALLATAPEGERVRRGALVVLVGPPNAGKSSLFNALLGRDRAMVTEMAGTTRDAIEAETTMDGYPVHLVDTAGLRDGGDRLETMGMERTHRWLDQADLIVQCVPPPDKTNEYSFTTEKEVLAVGTMADLGGHYASGDCTVSAATGAGLLELRMAIATRLRDPSRRNDVSNNEPLLTRARHQSAAAEALNAIVDAHNELLRGEPVLAAAALRGGAEALNDLIGGTDREEILDRVFAGFCIGK